MRRVVIVVPSLFTLFNLFFGIWAIVLASRGEFYRAGWYVVFAGILDALDGRVARLSGAGTRFGAELDSLVDVVSFGVAPAFLIYQLEFTSGGQAEWIFCYFYVMAAAIRLTVLMVGNVRYATVPRAGLRTVRGLLGLVTMLFILVFGLLEHDAFFFPLGVAYMAYGVLRAVFLGFLDEESEGEEAEIAGPIVITDGEPGADDIGERSRGIEPRGRVD